jgi:hypothetical protein
MNIEAADNFLTLEVLIEYGSSIFSRNVSYANLNIGAIGSSETVSKDKSFI